MNTPLREEAHSPLDASPMTRAQVLVICIAVLLAALDGYDVLAMAFVAPAVSAAWQLDKQVLGLLLGASLMGMAIGSIGLSPFADITGRKPLVLGGVGLMILGSLLSAFCQAVPTLAACRILTGIGIGVMVPLTATIGSEFANARRRPLAVTATTVGFTAGSVIGGLIAAALLKYADWPSVFLSGAIVGTALLPVVVFWLPESPVYLISRRPRGALERLNQVLARLGRPALTALSEAPSTRRASYRALFARNMIGMILSYAAVMVLVSSATYYLLNWLPQLIVESGFPPSTGSLVTATSSLVGIVGGLLLGLAANRIGPARLASAAFIGLGCAIGAFGLSPPILGLLLLAAGACGFFTGGAIGLFYATMTGTLPPLTRVSGIGLVIGVGRLFSVSGPTLAGWMFSAGLTRSGVSLIFGCAPIVAGILLFTVTRFKPPLLASSARCQ